MSIEAVSWALRVPVGGNTKVVLLGLANHAHPDGSESYPSLDTLAEYAACDRSTARRNVRKLVADGWAIEDGLGPRGQIKYRLPVGRTSPVGGGETPPESESDGGGGSGASEGVASVPPEPSKGTVQNQSKGERASAGTDDVTLHRLFRFWQDECGHPQAKFTPERKRAMRARLGDGYTPKQIGQAIRGAARAAYVDPETGKRHDDLTLICRNGSKVEDFIGRYTAQRPAAPARRSDGQPSVADILSA